MTQAVSDARLDQIRRSHKSARPKHDNIAWFNTHDDLTVVLQALDEALRELKAKRAEVDDAERRCDEWREQSNRDSALAVCNEKLRAELEASRQAVREARKYAAHLSDCVRRYYAYQDVKPIPCTCGLDAWLEAHPVEGESP